MKKLLLLFAATLFLSVFSIAVNAQVEAAAVDKQGADTELAKKLGADEYGMRNYILVILKSGPNQMKEGKERTEIFAGHLANIKRLAAEGKMALAGPFMKNDKDFRGLFIFAVDSVDEARKLTDTDPAIKAGILAPEFIPWYGSAALMMVNEAHGKLASKQF